MRELRFNVCGQSITKDRKCDFSGIVSGTQNYLMAKFSFDSQWNDMAKVAVFKCLNKEYLAKIKKDQCVIPPEALVWSNFSVFVVGQNKKGERIKTNSILLKQEVT